jgi:hypothetical protein
MVDSLNPYQPDVKKMIFFVEGKILDKPGRAESNIKEIKKRASKHTMAIKGIFDGKFSKACTNKEAAMKLLGSQMQRADWWFTVLVSKHLQSKPYLVLVLPLIDFKELGCVVYGLEDVEVDIQIAHYAANHKDAEFAVCGTDYDFFGLMKGISRVFSPIQSSGWYLDVEKFRKVICDHFGIDFEPLDIFIAYNLATNDNMKTHIKGVGFSKALTKLAQWIPAYPDRNTIADYSPFLNSLSGDPKECKSIVSEMTVIHRNFAWNGAEDSNLVVPEITTKVNTLSMYVIHTVYDY